jgi:hypothetical protein
MLIIGREASAMNVFMNGWYSIINSVESATWVLVIGGGFIGILAVVFFSISKLKKINSNLAIIASTLAGCLFMIPIISSFNNLVDLKIEGSMIDEGKAEIRAQRAEIERLKAENRIRQLEREQLENQITIAKQSLEIEALNDNIKLLENAELSIQSFRKILEVALLQMDLKQTLVRKEKLNDIKGGWGLQADQYYDEALVVIIHDISAKFGVDLNEVKITKLDGNTVVVSGIRSKFIGASKNISDAALKEIRRVNVKNDVTSIVVQNDSLSRERANKLANEYETQFQTRLSEGLEFGFMNDAVIQLAQNFIRVMLAPLYRDIRFDDEEHPESQPLMKHLQKELDDMRNKKIELSEINKDLLFLNENLEEEETKPQEEMDIID